MANRAVLLVGLSIGAIFLGLGKNRGTFSKTMTEKIIATNEVWHRLCYCVSNIVFVQSADCSASPLMHEGIKVLPLLPKNK